MSCFYCGKITKKSISFCNITCEKIYTDMFNQISKPIFRTFQEAAKFYKRDFRTMKKFEGSLFLIDKTLPSANTKWVICKSCGEQSSKSKARAGYCADCTIQGLGKKNQGKIISKKYKGAGNPNYLDGLSISLEYQSNDWYLLKKNLNYNTCAISSLTNNIDYHHIIPRWFCKLANIDIYDKNNIIGLNHDYHKVIHHLQLDIVLLPTLYFLYKKDAHQLQSQFVHLLQLHKVHQYPVDQLQSLSLFQVSRYPGKKKLLDLLPGFLQPFLPLLE
jgi:hypothetical protein